MKKRNFGLVKVNFVMFVIFIGYFLCFKFGIPYIYEKYGMPVDAVVYEISNGTMGALHIMSLLLTRKSTEEILIRMFMKEIQYVFGIFLFFLG